METAEKEKGPHGGGPVNGLIIEGSVRGSRYAMSSKRPCFS